MRQHGRIACVVAAVGIVASAAVSGAEEPKKPTLDELVKEYGPAFTIRVVDEAGKPVAGALAGSYGYYLDGSWRNGREGSRTTDANGEIRFEFGRDDLDGGYIFARHEGRRLAGFAAVAKAGNIEGELLWVTALPAKFVRGSLTCSKLPEDKVIASCGERIFIGKTPVLEYAGSGVKYEFLLPAGDYQFEVSGRYTHNVWLPLRIESGNGDVALDVIDVPPSQLALLRGKPAPELRGVVAWKNSGGVRLANLKGRYVILDFWGHWCGPCVANMPKLMALRDRFSQDKLAIVGVHVGLEGDDEVNSAERLDAALIEVRTNLWGGRDIPFPVALVKAEKTPYAEMIGEAGGVELGVTHARSQAAADYGVMGYPTKILIDREGRVVGDAHEFIDSDEGVTKLAKLIGAE